MILKNKKISLIECLELTAFGLNALITNNNADYQVVDVVSKKASSFNCSFIDLSSIFNEYSVTYLYADEFKFNTNVHLSFNKLLAW